MALYSSMSSCEQRCRAQVAAKVWVVAHSARDRLGKIVARFVRYMSPSQPSEGGWRETDQDNVN